MYVQGDSFKTDHINITFMRDNMKNIFNMNNFKQRLIFCRISFLFYYWICKTLYDF